MTLTHLTKQDIDNASVFEYHNWLITYKEIIKANKPTKK